jgi:hypothetical protein
MIKERRGKRTKVEVGGVLGDGGGVGRGWCRELGRCLVLDVLLVRGRQQLHLCAQR